MSKDIFALPTGKIEGGTGRQEIEAGLRQFGAAFARQHLVQLLAHRMQIQHVAGGIFQLLGGQRLGAPVG